MKKMETQKKTVHEQSAKLSKWEDKINIQHEDEKMITLRTVKNGGIPENATETSS